MAAGKKTGGRSAGTQNKLTGTAKENIAAVFVKLGGTTAMAEWAKENQTSFYNLYSKLIPVQLTGDSENPIQHQVSFSIIDPKNDN